MPPLAAELSDEEENMKRVETVLRAAALMLAALALGGCKGKAASTESGGPQAVKVFGIDKQYTLDGKNLQLSDWDKGTIPSRIWETFTGALAKNGVKLELELVMADQIDTAFQTMLASGRLNDYDFVSAGNNVDAKTRIGMANQKRMYPVNKLVQEHSSGAARDFYTTGIGRTYAKLSTLEDGNFYWLTHTTATHYKTQDVFKGSLVSGNIRKDWLDAAGLGIPQSLEEFYAALAAFQQKDVNGNGLKDEVASISLENFNTGIAQWFGLGTGIVSSMDYRVTSPWYQDRAKDYFTYVNRLYRAGFLNVNSEGNDMAANRIAYTRDWSIETWLEPGVAVQAGAAKAYYAPFVFRALPDIPFRVWSQEGVGLSYGMHFVPSGAKNLSGVGRMLDYIVTMDYAVLTDIGIEGYTFNYDGDGMVKVLGRTSETLGLDGELVMAGIPAPWTNTSILPRFERNDRMGDLVRVIDAGKRLGYPETGFSLKADFFVPSWDHGAYPLIQDLDAVMAYPTAAEIDRSSAIRPDLETYSKELCTALILGEKSLSNWESYIADLKRLGLDEYIAIHQARVDRAR
jgi:ABC-type glycerol-3-phosphate transport system substrate-binding protein